MSETTSSPSVNLYPVSPSSSLSSTDSAPRSEPTSDEQPDLGFNELLREYSHLQPHPRIPIQIRSATSSTTPTYHAESVTGSDFRIRSGRGNSRVTQSALSTLSTFTRPPTSSIQPDGSTVWADPLIASYLPRSTLSNGTYPEDEEESEECSRFESASRASTPLTVEIRDIRSSDGESHQLDPGDSSPEPSSAIPIQVEGENQRLDPIETPHTEDDIDSLLSHNQRGEPSVTSRELRRTVTSSSQEQSDNSSASMQLRSQVIPDASTVTSTSSLSFSSDSDAAMSVSIAPSSSSINTRFDSTVGAPTLSESTLMNVFLSPIPPRIVTDSSYPTTRTTTSSLSLISYQLPETPSDVGVHREESESEMISDRRRLHPNGHRSISSATSISIAMPSLASSNSRSTASTQRPFNSNFSIPDTDSALQNPHSVLAGSPLTNPHSLNAESPLLNPHSLPATSPLPNPYSSVATPETGLRLPTINDQFIPTSLGNTAQSDHSRAIIVNDVDTPSEIAFEPPLRFFEPIHDDEDEPGHQISNQRPIHLQTLSGMRPINFLTYEANYSRQSTGESYRPGGRTPRYLSGHTPRGIPTQATSSETHPLEQRPEVSDALRSSGETNYVPDAPSEDGRFVSASRTEITTIPTHLEPFLQLRKQGTAPPSSNGFEEEHSSQEKPRTQQVYPSSVGLHLLPSQPLRALVVPPSSSASLLRQNNSFLSQSQFPAGAADPEAEQLDAEASTSQTGLLPSLGYLDEALSFIASERVRLTAARASVGNLTSGGASSSKELGRESGGDDNGLQQQEGEEWRDAIGAEKEGESKRKRRRKRPSKQPGQPMPPEPSPAIDRNSADGSQRPGSSSSPKKRRSKSAAPPLSSSASVLSLSSSKSGTMTPGRRKDKHKGKEFLIPPPPPSSSDPRSNIADSDLDDGGRTPTNVPVPGIIRVSTLLGINPTGAKGKRIGRREREKLKFDPSKSWNHNNSRDPDSFDEQIDIGVEYNSNTNNDGAEATEENGDGNGENDSISNMSLLQPPRRLRNQTKSKPGETSLGLITKEAPTTTIGLISSQSSINFHTDEINTRDPVDHTSDGDLFSLKRGDIASGEKEKEKKRRTRPKPTRPIVHSRSYPTLDVAAEPVDKSQLKSAMVDKMNKFDECVDRNQAPELFGLQNQGELAPTNRKQPRLLALTQNLQQLFPEQREELAWVVKRVEKRGVAPSSLLSPDSSELSLGKPIPILVPTKGKKAKKGHNRAASDGAITTGSDSLGIPHVPRPMTDVEEEEDIDPRGRPPKKKDPLIHVFIDHSNILIGLLSHLRRASPYRKRVYISRRKPLPVVVASSTTQAKYDPAVVKPTSSRPLPLLPTKADQTSPAKDYPIPLPSFATPPRSFPSASLLSSLRKADDAPSSEEFERQIASDGCDGSGMEGGHVSGGNNSGSGLTWQKEKKPSKHLWHAALILILERGRPITRRVVVASSPLYQPMETIERFGYDLRVFVRVPDLGDGMDRDHNAEKGKSSVGKTNSTKRISGSESGSGGNASGAGGNNSLHPYYAKSNLGTSPGKVKYREQGVDELLQLKLHQAIAASDDVPDGSTIILATGDGNMGQFNEEGFLGPIRTALRRGWKVELYAWEGGLSRAWKREFGEDTEWGKRGRFRIIGMEQFASWLVEASEWA